MNADLEFIVHSGLERGRTIRFPSAQFTIGSGAQAAVQLATLEPRHAEVEVDALGKVWVRDLTGQRQLTLNGERLERGPLEPGGSVLMGGVELRLGLVTDTAAPILSPGQRRDARQAAETLARGDIVDGRYEIIGKLAEGGMGEVYSATHVELGKAVVIKVMRAQLSDDPHIVARFKREAIAASSIGHQNIVDVSDFGRTPDERFFFVMEYLDGVTLKHLIAQEGHQPVPRVIHLVRQMANALSAAHSRGIVHRDLKPENIMLLQRPGQRDFIKVVDFGVAKVALSPGQLGQTSLGMVMGTPQYMSPEQARATVVDARSDIYSLGLIFYELLSGQPTFVAETPSLVMLKQLSEAPRAFEPHVVAALPSEVERLVFRMLAKDPAQRIQTMKEVADELAAIEARVGRSDFVLARIAAGPTEAQRPRLPSAVASPTPPAPPTIKVSMPVRPPTPTQVPTPKATPRARRAPVVFASLGALTLVAVTAMWWPRAPLPQPAAVPARPAPAPAAQPAAQERPPKARPPVTLRIGSTTVADVFEGDVLVGQTPLTLTRPSGTQTVLRFKAVGFNTLTRNVAFESDDALTVALEKAAAPAVKKPLLPATKPLTF